MFTLFYAPGTCALASYIALIDADAPYQLKRIDFAKSEQKSADYAAVNPKARVPALATPRGILAETPAILAFIAQSFPDKRLAPLYDPFAFARVAGVQRLSLRDAACRPRPSHARRPLGRRALLVRGYEAQGPAIGRRQFPARRDDDAARAFVIGEAYSIADAYLFTLSQWLEADGIDLSPIPRVVDHRARMRERPSVKRALEEERRSEEARAEQTSDWAVSASRVSGAADMLTGAATLYQHIAEANRAGPQSEIIAILDRFVKPAR